MKGAFPFDISGVFPVNESEIAAVSALILEKEYGSDALSHIKNYSRTLNYWAEGAENLLPDQSKGHHKFSFLDLVWLGLVKELRDLGLSKSGIYTLKGQLLADIDVRSLFGNLEQNKAELEAYMIKKGARKKEAALFVKLLIDKQETFSKEKQALLLNHIYDVVIRKQSVYLLINKEGHHKILYEQEFGAGDYDSAFKDFYNAPHISIHLNSLVSFFLARDYITDTLKEKLFSKDEWKIITTIRTEKPDAITVRFSGEGKVESLEVTKLKKVQLEARLSEIIAAGSYETITIVTQNGKPVSLKKQKKIK